MQEQKVQEQQLQEQQVQDAEQEARHWPVRVTLRSATVSRGRWEVEQWSLVDCCSDRGHPREALTLEEVVEGETATDYHWGGLALALFRDERAAYRFNLGSNNPRVFVICHEDEGVMQPYLVTACQDEAASYMDAGEEDVFSLPMPAAMQCWIEAFIGRHGEPEMAVGKSKRRHHGKRESAKEPAAHG